MTEPRLCPPDERPEPRKVDDRLLPRVATGPLRLRGDVAGLCRVVAEADVMSAAYAIDFLGDLGDRAATDLLLTVVTSRLDMLTYRAALALGELREPRAVPALVDLLAEEADFPGHRQDAACQALAGIGDPAAVPPLLTAAANRRHFGSIPAARPPLEALASFDPDVVVPGLLANLWDYLQDARGPIAVRILGRLGSPAAIPALTYLALADRPGQHVRRAAVRALTHIATDESGYRLYCLLGDPDPWIAEAAAEIIAGNEKDRHLLESALRGGEPVIRQTACHGLGATGDRRFVPVLADRLRADKSSAVRRAAATALRELGGPDATAALFGALGDGSVGDIVTDALAAAPEPPVTELLDLLRTPTQRQAAARALGRLGDPSSGAALLDVLPDSTGAVRAEVVAALGALRHMPALPALVAIAEDPAESGTVRARAVWACGDRDLALRALTDPLEAVRLRAADALGRFPDEDVVGALISLIGNDTLDVQQAAVRSLGDIGRCAETAVLALLDGSHDDVIRRWAADQLPRCAGPSAVDALASLAFDDDHAVASAAVTCLAASDAEQALITVLSHRHPRVRRGTDPRHVTALHALASIGGDRAVTAIAELAILVCPKEARAELTRLAAGGTVVSGT
ncbi:MAG TPA: HEAT repeat domain-containing protein [Pseudonocardiaceae bacterium]|nr:HEAT repeat domain-containing protein [Pseudonocardiaceae bacterium]